MRHSFVVRICAVFAVMATTAVQAQTPTFSKPKEIPSTVPSGLDYSLDLAGNFDGNGNTDLIVYQIQNTGTKILFFAGNGTGSFTNEGAIANIPFLTGVQLVADVNGDGKEDIIAVRPGCDAVGDANCGNGGNDTGGSVQVMLSEGNGKFAQTYEASLPVGLDSVQAVAGDFNKDGKIDFAVLVYSADRPESLPPTELYVFLNQGNGSFSPTIYQTPAVLSNAIQTTNLVTGDFEGNGNLDLALAFDMGSAPVIYPEIMAFAGNGKGDFGPGVVKYTLNYYSLIDLSPYSGNNTLIATDLNSDGRTDLVIGLEALDTPQRARHYTAIANLIADTSGGFKWGSAIHFAPEFPFGVGVSDVNGDGHPDLIFTTTNISGSEYNYGGIYLGTATGQFQTPHMQFNVPGHITGPYVNEVPLKKGALPSLFVSNSTAGIELFINTTK